MESGSANKKILIFIQLESQGGSAYYKLMAKISHRKQLKNWNSNSPQPKPGKLRIVGGKYRGRQIEYLGDRRTRPMKDNIREALFNLVGGWIPGKAIIDLFAGTGAVGIEAISRGATRAILIERHFPTAKVVKRNIETIDAEMPAVVESMDTFFWGRQFCNPETERPAEPWVVFCCAPYDFYVDREEETLALLKGLKDLAPDQSIVVVESDSRFNPKLLPDPESWVVRDYRPARVAVFKKGDAGFTPKG